nr:hypothetical protein [Tanacetum cinerariifolium]
MEHEIPNRCDDITDYVEENINIAEEKEEVPMKDVEMDEKHDIDHSGTKEALQWSLAKDPFLVIMELNDQSSGVSCCLELSMGEEDLMTLEIPTVKNSLYRGSNRRSNSCCDGAVVSAEGETFYSWGVGPELS